jgi:uncharacterized protein YdgA (DUF945 family)
MDVLIDIGPLTLTIPLLCALPLTGVVVAVGWLIIAGAWQVGGMVEEGVGFWASKSLFQKLVTRRKQKITQTKTQTVRDFHTGVKSAEQDFEDLIKSLQEERLDGG